MHNNLCYLKKKMIFLGVCWEGGDGMSSRIHEIQKILNNQISIKIFNLKKYIYIVLSKE